MYNETFSILKFSSLRK